MTGSRGRRSKRKKEREPCRFRCPPPSALPPPSTSARARPLAEPATSSSSPSPPPPSRAGLLLFRSHPFGGDELHGRGGRAVTLTDWVSSCPAWSFFLGHSSLFFPWLLCDYTSSSLLVRNTSFFPLSDQCSSTRVTASWGLTAFSAKNMRIMFFKFACDSLAASRAA
jgi:hypothetical protein